MKAFDTKFIIKERIGFIKPKYPEEDYSDFGVHKSYKIPSIIFLVSTCSKNGKKVKDKKPLYETMTEIKGWNIPKNIINEAKLELLYANENLIEETLHIHNDIFECHE